MSNLRLYAGEMEKTFAPSNLMKSKPLYYMFLDLEKSLQYPNCEGKADAARILSDFENKLIMGGFV